MSVLLTLTLTPDAVTHLQTVLHEAGLPNGGLRVYVHGGGCAGFQYGLQLEDAPDAETDVQLLVSGIPLYVDPISARYLREAVIDFVESPMGGRFVVTNPQATSTCGCGASFAG
ncbi:MAG: HesB/IscA family protein [Ilumatobacteraceae bacterium]